MAKDRLERLTGSERLGQHRESEYLGAEDIDPGKEPVLTIEGIWNGLVTLQRGKENKDVITFTEKSVSGLRNVRPLIVNSTNRKVLKKLFGGVQACDLEGKQIQLYVDNNVRDPQSGGVTEGVRIKPHKPRLTEPVPPCANCGNTIEGMGNKNADYLAKYTTKHYGQPLCATCAAEAKATKESVPVEESKTDSESVSNEDPEVTSKEAAPDAVE